MAKTLYRSVNNRKIAGVCGGLADYLDANATVIRLAFVILLILGVAPIILIYLVMWVIVPENPGQTAKA